MSWQPLVIPVLHPAYILRGQERFVGVLERDLKRAAFYAVNEWKTKKHVWICWDADPDKRKQMCDYALQVLRYWRSTSRCFGIDTETTRARPTRCQLKTVSVSPHGSNEAVAIPLMPGLLDPLTRELLFNEVKALCADLNVTKIIHNQTFDATVLARHQCPVAGPVVDTLVLAHIVDPSVPHDLQAVASTYTDTEAWKVDFDTKENKEEASLEDLLYYNGCDAIGCQQLADPLYGVARDYNLLTVAAKEMQYVELARQMEVSGIYCDRVEMDRLGLELFHKLERLTHELRTDLNWPDMDLGKPSHKMHFLYELLKLPVRS